MLAALSKTLQACTSGHTTYKQQLVASLDEELAVYTRLVQRFTTASDSSARLHVAMAMFNKSHA